MLIPVLLLLAGSGVTEPPAALPPREYSVKPGHLWVSTETGLTVQFALTDAPLPRKEWTHLKVGPQAPSLFEIPKGYRKDAP